jgi:hypothetical protein
MIKYVLKRALRQNKSYDYPHTLTTERKRDWGTRDESRASVKLSVESPFHGLFHIYSRYTKPFVCVPLKKASRKYCYHLFAFLPVKIFFVLFVILHFLYDLLKKRQPS